MPLRTYHLQFRNQVDMLSSVGIHLGTGPGMNKFLSTIKDETGKPYGNTWEHMARNK